MQAAPPDPPPPLQAQQQQQLMVDELEFSDRSLMGLELSTLEFGGDGEVCSDLQELG